MDLIFQLLVSWIDLVWLLLVFVTLKRKNWLCGIGYVLSCVFMLRMQVDLMQSIGYPRGVLPILSEDVFTRGLVVYGAVSVVYFLWAYYLRDSRPVIFMAHSIALFFIALVASMVVMVL